MVWTKYVFGAIQMYHCRNLLYFLCVTSNHFTFLHPLSCSPLQLSPARGNGNALFKAKSVILSPGDVLWWWNFQLPLVNSKEDLAASAEAQRQNTQHSSWKRTQMRLASRCPFKSGVLCFPLARGNITGCQALADPSTRPGGAAHWDFTVKKKKVLMRFNAAVAPFFLEEKQSLKLRLPRHWKGSACSEFPKLPCWGGSGITSCITPQKQQSDLKGLSLHGF